MKRAGLAGNIKSASPEREDYSQSGEKSLLFEQETLPISTKKRSFEREDSASVVSTTSGEQDSPIFTMDSERNPFEADPSGLSAAGIPSETTGDDSAEEGSKKRPAADKKPSEKRRRRRTTSSKHDHIIESNPELDLHNDLTTVAGQVAHNPGLTHEQAKTAAKREYNRRNAARARLRNKHMVAELQEKCAELTQRTEELERENELLRAQLAVLQSKSEDQATSAPAASTSFLPSSSVATANPFLSSLAAAAPTTASLPLDQLARLAGGLSAMPTPTTLQSQLQLQALFGNNPRSLGGLPPDQSLLNALLAQQSPAVPSLLRSHPLAASAFGGDSDPSRGTDPSNPNNRQHLALVAALLQQQQQQQQDDDATKRPARQT